MSSDSSSDNDLKNAFDLESKINSFSSFLQQRVGFSQNDDNLRYLGILETYGVDWSIEKVARDTLQNFFDSNNYTLDGVSVKVFDVENEYVVRIESDAEYDFRRLVNLGGTTKLNDPFSAGGFGEGSEIISLSLLRDYEFSQIKFGSKNWELDFVLSPVSKNDYVENINGLHASVKTISNNVDGNFIEFKTSNKDYAHAFVKAKKLFFSSENIDFISPSLDVAGFGGFKYLPPEEGSIISPRGNFYFSGQRRHVDKEEWNTVKNMSLWTYKKFGLSNDRDRGLVSKRDIEEQIIPTILDAASTEDLSRLLFEMKYLWSNSWSFELGNVMLKGIVTRLHNKNINFVFEDNYLSSTSRLSLSIKSSFQQQGYFICSDFLNKIGMKSVQTKFIDIQEHYKIEPSLMEEKNISILYSAASLFKKDPKNIWVFNMKDEKSIISGQYDDSFVWLSKETLNKPFPKALATYLHELDHKFGTDQSAEFSYALTNTLGDVVQGLLDNPLEYKLFNDDWIKK